MPVSASPLDSPGGTSGSSDAPSPRVVAASAARGANAALESGSLDDVAVAVGVPRSAGASPTASPSAPVGEGPTAAGIPAVELQDFTVPLPGGSPAIPGELGPLLEWQPRVARSHHWDLACMVSLRVPVRACAGRLAAAFAACGFPVLRTAVVADLSIALVCFPNARLRDAALRQLSGSMVQTHRTITGAGPEALVLRRFSLQKSTAPPRQCGCGRVPPAPLPRSRRRA